MKTILYMGISVNGAIARSDFTVDWNSEEGWKSFYAHGKDVGNFVMGGNTFRVAVGDGTFPFEGAINVVMTHRPVENVWGDRAIFTDKSPKEVLAMLEERDFKTALLIGGGELNSSFAKENLIDEVYLDIEPLAFGKGIPVFDSTEFEMNLRLRGIKNLNQNTVQLHYEVIK